MRVRGVLAAALAVLGTASAGEAATMTYWSLFNVENDTFAAPAYVTYAALGDMLNDENRTGVFVPDGFAGGTFAGNVVGSDSDGTSFWSLFNVEDETATAPAYVTYAALGDMLNDENRTGVFVPDGFAGGAFAGNIIGSGSDGTTYWSLFNVENETTTAPAYVTYAALEDMLNDENRTGVFVPDGYAGGAFAGNVVGSASDGTSYWSLFNVEDETATAPAYVTYATLQDMLNDENRTGVFVPDGFAGGAFAGNVVGSGAFVTPDVAPIPVPAAAWLLVSALFGLGSIRRLGKVTARRMPMERAV